MITSTSDFARDQWGRPMPFIGDRPTTCDRSSGLSSALADSSNLKDWMAQRVVEGLRERPDLLDSMDPLKDIAKAAALAGGSEAGAALGTAVHEAVSSYYLSGVMPDPSTPEGACAASAVEMLDSRFEVLASELTVVDPIRKVAGTCDLLVRSLTTGGVHIADLKTTGSDASTASRFSGLGWSVQLTAYAHSLPYQNDEVVTWADLDLPEPDRSVAVVAHVNRDTYEASLLAVDLDVTLVEQALAVKATRKLTLARVVR